MALVLSAACDLSQSPAACQQIDIAACALRDHCGGVDASTCEAGRVDPHLLGCGTTSEDAATCIDAINGVISGECISIPLDLPCPNTIFGIAGEACAADEECGGGLPCEAGLCGGPTGGDPVGSGIPGAPYVSCAGDGDCDSGLACRRIRGGGVCTVECEDNRPCPTVTGTSNPDLVEPRCGTIDFADNNGSCMAHCRSPADCDSGLVCDTAGNCAP